MACCRAAWSAAAMFPFNAAVSLSEVQSRCSRCAVVVQSWSSRDREKRTRGSSHEATVHRDKQASADGSGWFAGIDKTVPPPRHVIIHRGPRLNSPFLRHHRSTLQPPGCRHVKKKNQKKHSLVRQKTPFVVISLAAPSTVESQH